MEISGKVGRRETLSVKYLDMPKSRLVEHSETARMVRRLHTTALNFRSIIDLIPNSALRVYCLSACEKARSVVRHRGTPG